MSGADKRTAASSPPLGTHADGQAALAALVRLKARDAARASLEAATDCTSPQEEDG